MANGTSKPKGALIAALIFFLLGLVGCGIAAATTIPFITDLVDWVSEIDDFAQTNRMGESATFTADGEDGVVLLTSEAACTGEGPDGAVRFDAYQSFGTGTNVDFNGQSYEGYQLFDTRTGASYTITCGSGGAGSFIVITAPTFLIEGFGAAGFGILSGLGGAVFMFIAVILLIVGLVQRSSWKKRNQGPPPGAYGAPGAVPPAPGAPGVAPPPPGGVPGAQPQAPPPPAQQPGWGDPNPTQPPPAQPQAPPPPAQQPGWGDPNPTQPPPGQPPAAPPPPGGG